ncbi:MAG TPA: hypothetical protein DCX32_04170 [Candidatus Moranbacteria bacterium]|nr:MAG: hypothetical protein UW87_C0008G0016 [Candidatus Moranbacteria bacterium GW2011_GWC2_45_10]KKT93066.1 MAG: hypothetical protein UW95_C0026G0007 [Parcubacteria group bacterium GW2011_GWC1_45_14]HAV11703.1 hypothetical protein [Candidatus Moranbacteria bacterium]
MPTTALDLATIIKAFLELESRGFPKGGDWTVVNDLQREVLGLFEEYHDRIAALRDLEGSADFEPPMSIKVTTVLDKTVRWLEGIAEKSRAIRKGSVDYPAFRLTQGCSVFEVEGFSGPLLVVETKNGDKLWIMMTDVQSDGMEMVRTAFRLLGSKKEHHSEYVHYPDAVIPKVYFNLRPDISFLLGAGALKGGYSWVINRAEQKFKFRMNEEGARARVETSLGLFGCSIREKPRKKTIEIDRPFIGFFTQADSGFPMAVFYADYDCWKE